MSTKRRTPAVSANGVQNHNPAHPVTEAVSVKFTYNAKSDTESLTIRTDSEEELEELIGRWKSRIVQKPKQKMNDGDKCPECDGFMTAQKGHNRTTGKEYYYLGCSNYPKCQYSAYIAQQLPQQAVPA